MAKEAGAPQQWLAETKFHPPHLREDVILRQQLLHDLHREIVDRPLTLISAPAGYGKTTLLATLHATFPDLSLAWLSLDAQDNDPVRFLTALIVALQRLNPSCCPTALALLSGQGGPALEEWRVVSVLINDVLASFTSSFVLILDDLHVITNPSIFIALDYLLEHMPRQMHLAVSTRVDPPMALARLRARAQIAELRLARLRFSNAEATLFLNGRLGLELAPDEVNALLQRTEGWPVGLRLLAGSMERAQSAVDRQTILRQFAQADHHLFNFLAEEVLNQQEPDVRTFLLETAILPVLTPDLCRAVTGRTDAADLLQDLLQRNMFLLTIALQPHGDTGLSSADQPAYRYHDLFAEFLAHRLWLEMPQRVPELHQRAALATNDPAQVIAHYLSAGSWPEAAAAIEQAGPALLATGYLGTLSDWISALPPAVREKHPRLLYYLSLCTIWQGQWQEAHAMLQRALRGFEASGDRAGQGEVLARLAAITAWPRSDYQESEALLNRALQNPLPHDVRVEALLERASLKLSWGDWVTAESDFNEAMRMQQSVGNGVLHLFSSHSLDPGLAFLPGGLDHMQRICDRAKADVGEVVSPVRLVIDEMTTVLHLFRGRLKEAIRSGESALTLRERLGGHPFLGMDAAFFLSIAYAALGDYAALERLFELLFLGVQESTQPEAHVAGALYFAGRIRWLQALAAPPGEGGNGPGRSAYLQEAREIYDQMCALEDPQREVPADGICRIWMWSLLEMAAGRYLEAERALRRPEVLQQKDRYSTIQGNTRLMLARLYLQLKRPDDALAELNAVLAYHRQLGIPFAILLEGQSIVPLLRLAVEEGLQARYAAGLLSMLGAADKPRVLRVPATGATLTSRELQVLGLLAGGADNRTIGARLTIAESTVKTHIYHIFAKLDVANRTEAAVRARELELL